MAVGSERIAPKVEGEINGKFRRLGALPSNLTTGTGAQGKEVVFENLYARL